jgi:hypothetical protein
MLPKNWNDETKPRFNNLGFVSSLAPTGHFRYHDPFGTAFSVGLA